MLSLTASAPCPIMAGLLPPRTTAKCGGARARLALASSAHLALRRPLSGLGNKCRVGRSGSVAVVSAASQEKGIPGYSSGRGPTVEDYDFVVIGSGIAGLSYAIKVAKYGRVAIVTKDYASEGCTAYAQGGICAVLDMHDSVEKHVSDTMVAGCFLNDERAVQAVCSEGAQRVLELVKMGAEFTRNQDGSLHLTREGGHSDRRIVHAADVTGAEIERALLASARASPNIDFYEHHLAIDLVTGQVGGSKAVLGVDVLDQRCSALSRFVAPVTMLASGGGGQVYPNTTNPHVSTGDGIAMAHRARAVIANMEFVQFHPTGLYTPQGASYPTASLGSSTRRFLISEAVRGEGGQLYNLSGERFMSKYDTRLELAPRDVVARSIDDQMKSRGESHVLLDISHKKASTVMGHFPNIAARCLQEGIDIRNDPIPVVPTQHYMCGGVQTGIHGETSVLGLYAAGEVSCTGLHGANRLASNSLLEGLVFGYRAAEASIVHAESMKVHGAEALALAMREAAALLGEAPRPLSSAAREWVGRKRSEVNRIMWDAAGIVRTTTGLAGALEDLAQVYVESEELARNQPINTDMLELVNLVTVGELIVSSAMLRTESRGLHYCVDYPPAAGAGEAAARPTLINQSLKKRFDLQPYQSKLASAGGIRASLTSQQQGLTPFSPGSRSPSPFKSQAKRREMITRSSPLDENSNPM